MASKKIQDLIDKVKPGGTLKLHPPEQEYQGPIVIRKPITIDGQHSNFWCKEKGPVLSIESNGVVIDDLNIAITGKESKLSGVEACALVVKQGLAVNLNNVTVKGNVLGLDEEEGDWRYPRSIKLSLKPGQPHDFKVKIIAPVQCKLKSEISGLTIQPSGLKGGEETEVTLKTEALSQGVRLKGDIFLKTACLSRKIEVTSHQVQKGGECTCKVTYWDTTGAKTPSSPTPSDTKTLPTEPPHPPEEPPRPPKKEPKKPLRPPRRKPQRPFKPIDQDETRESIFIRKAGSKSAKGRTDQSSGKTNLLDGTAWAHSDEEPHKDRQEVQQATKKSGKTTDKLVDSQTTKAVSKEDKSAATKDSTTKDSAKSSSRKKSSKVTFKDLSDSFSAFSPPVDKSADKQKANDEDDKSEEKQQSEVDDKKTKSPKPKERKFPKKRKTMKWDGGPTAFDSDT
jgi:hypothetical protein